MQPITLIKIGGSLFTDKTKPGSVRQLELEQIAQEVAAAIKLGKPIILGHGVGSFAHVPAKKYQTHKGVTSDSSLQGIVEVADSVRQVSAIFMRALFEQGVRAVSVSPLSMMTGKNHDLQHIFVEPIEQLLHLGILPVVCGDQILDSSVGCTIFPTEKVLAYLAADLRAKGYQIERMIHCTQTDGVYDAAGNVIPLINEAVFDQHQADFGGSEGIDVSGGMRMKVEETLELAKRGIPGLIINGITTSLAKAVAGKAVGGTEVVSQDATEELMALDQAKMPQHVAIICDGNRRWARSKGWLPFAGHEYAVKHTIDELIDRAASRQISFLTFWLFSTENWDRDAVEIDYLMNLFRYMFDQKIEQLGQKNIRVRVIGDKSRLAPDIQDRIARGEAQTAHNTGMTVVVALNYGGRDEIVRAVKKLVESGASSDEITDQLLANNLDTAGMPDPDLIIRTSGELRLSGFMAWQQQYAELFFAQTPFPDFGGDHLDKALESFQKRQRRFGKG